MYVCFKICFLEPKAATSVTGIFAFLGQNCSEIKLGSFSCTEGVFRGFCFQDKRKELKN